MGQEIRALHLELGLRHRPGQPVERRWHRERIHRLLSRCAPLPGHHAPLHRVVGMELLPRRHIASLSLRLAGRRRTNALPTTDAQVGAEPLAANAARRRTRHPPVIADRDRRRDFPHRKPRRTYPVARLPDRGPPTVIEALGTTGSEELPPETPAVVLIRVIAAVLERTMLARQLFDVRCGWSDSSKGANPRDWCERVQQVAAALKQLGPAAPWKEQMLVAARFWRIEPLQRDTGVIFDLATGDAFGPAAKGVTSLWTRFKRTPRIDPLADWVVQQLEA